MRDSLFANELRVRPFLAKTNRSIGQLRPANWSSYQLAKLPNMPKCRWQNQTKTQRQNQKIYFCVNCAKCNNFFVFLLRFELVFCKFMERHKTDSVSNLFSAYASYFFVFCFHKRYLHSSVSIQNSYCVPDFCLYCWPK